MDRAWLTSLAHEWSPGLWRADWDTVLDLVATPEAAHVTHRYYRADMDGRGPATGRIATPTTVIYGTHSQCIRPALFADLDAVVRPPLHQHADPRGRALAAPRASRRRRAAGRGRAAEDDVNEPQIVTLAAATSPSGRSATAPTCSCCTASPTTRSACGAWRRRSPRAATARSCPHCPATRRPPYRPTATCRWAPSRATWSACSTTSASTARTVVGHDWGGIVGYRLGAEHPARLASLTALAVCHDAGFAVRRSVLREQQTGAYAWILAYASARAEIAADPAFITAAANDWSPGLHRADWPDVLAVLTRPEVAAAVSSYYRTDIAGDGGGCGVVADADARHPRRRRRLHRAGACSPAWTTHFAQPLTTIELPGIGHWPHLEAPADNRRGSSSTICAPTRERLAVRDARGRDRRRRYRRPGRGARPCIARGVDARVLEAARQIRPLGVGINLLPSATRVMAGLGLLERLLEGAVETGELVFFNRHGQRIWREPRGRAAGYDHPQVSCHRGALQALLLDAVVERLGPDAVVCGQAVTGYGERDGHVDVDVLDRATGAARTLAADLLVGRRRHPLDRPRRHRAD